MGMRQRDTRSFRAFLRGDIRPTKTESAEKYRQWRATVPYSNAQIAGAFLRLAADMDTENVYLKAQFMKSAMLSYSGSLSGNSLSVVLPLLVKTCAVCGGKALYRYGWEGRCKKHKYIVAGSELERRKAWLDKNKEFDLTIAENDTKTLHEASLKNCKKGHSHK